MTLPTGTGVPPDQPPVVAVQGVSKSFAGVEVLHDIDLAFEAGEVHALLGENGAGKSTFARILAGVHSPSRGRIRVGFKEVELSSPLAARRHGITLIHQEPVSFPDLSIAENLAVGRPGAWFSRFDRKRILREARVAMDQLGVALDVREPMRGLSIADQQMVEIARALDEDSRLIIMDEPTAALTPQETATLFAIIRRMRKAGRTIVLITHRLGEVHEICERATIFRDGERISTAPVAELTDAEIIRLMIGRPLRETRRSRAVCRGEVALAASNLCIPGRVENVSFELCRGEVLGMAGLIGAGRTDVASLLFGLWPESKGIIHVDGREAAIRAPVDAIRLGIGFVPEDRALAGIFASMSLESNITAAVPYDFARGGFIDRTAERALASQMIKRLEIHSAGSNQPISELSGGNQQKAILGRWLLTHPRILILDEPTRGIDVGVKAEFYEIIGQLAAGGCAILLISSELPELLSLCDRILVMSEGRLTAQYTHEQANADAIMKAAVPGARLHETRSDDA